MDCTLSKSVGHCPTNHNIMFTLVKHCAGQCPANAEINCTLSKSVEKCWTLSGKSLLWTVWPIGDVLFRENVRHSSNSKIFMEKIGCCLANLDVICIFVKRCNYTLVKHCVGHCLVNPEMNVNAGQCRLALVRDNCRIVDTYCKKKSP